MAHVYMSHVEHTYDPYSCAMTHLLQCRIYTCNMTLFTCMPLLLVPWAYQVWESVCLGVGVSVCLCVKDLIEWACCITCHSTRRNESRHAWHTQNKSWHSWEGVMTHMAYAVMSHVTFRFSYDGRAASPVIAHT